MIIAPSAKTLATFASVRPAHRRETSNRKTLGTLVWVALLLFAGEVGLRVRAWQRHGSNAPVADIYEPDALLGRRLRPGTTLSGTTRRLSINRWGFRGPDIPRAKPPGTIRIASIGYSTKFGMEASDDDSVWVQHLIRSLNDNLAGTDRDGSANVGGDRRYDAVNGAVPGYTLAVSIEQLTDRIASFEPDIVVVNQVTTDIAAHSRRQFGRPAQTQAASSPVGRFFHQNSMLLNLVRQNTAAFRSKRIPQRLRGLLDDRGVADYAKRLADLVDLCRQRGWKIIFCTCPRSFGDDTASTDQYKLAATALANNPALSLRALNNAFDRYNDAIRNVADLQGVPLVDLDRQVPRRPDYFVDAVHLNDAGHRLVGELVTEAILRAAVQGGIARSDP